MFLPRTSSTLAASLAGNGDVNIPGFNNGCSGSATRGYGTPNVRGSVIVPVRADAAAVSGLTRQT